jgi:hypothetical protein
MNQTLVMHKLVVFRMAYGDPNFKGNSLVLSYELRIHGYGLAMAWICDGYELFTVRILLYASSQ